MEAEAAGGHVAPTAHVFSVATVSRVHYLVVADAAARAAWVGALASALRQHNEAQAERRRRRGAQAAAEAAPPASGMLASHSAVNLEELGGGGAGDELQASELFLHKSSRWRCRRRRVLNCRRLAFPPPPPPNATSATAATAATAAASTAAAAAATAAAAAAPPSHPCDIVARALRLSFSAHSELDARSLATFLDAAAEVKRCNLRRLSERDRLTFFLNAYHLMVSPAYLSFPTAHLRKGNMLSPGNRVSPPSFCHTGQPRIPRARPALLLARMALLLQHHRVRGGWRHLLAVGARALHHPRQ